MLLRNDMVITLANGRKYVILENIPYCGIKYMHLVRANDECTEVINEFLVVKELLENDKTYIEVVNDEEELEIVLPLLKMAYTRRHKELNN